MMKFLSSIACSLEIFATCHIYEQLGIFTCWKKEFESDYNGERT